MLCVVMCEWLTTIHNPYTYMYARPPLHIHLSLLHLSLSHIEVTHNMMKTTVATPPPAITIEEEAATFVLLCGEDCRVYLSHGSFEKYIMSLSVGTAMVKNSFKSIVHGRFETEEDAEAERDRLRTKHPSAFGHNGDHEFTYLFILKSDALRHLRPDLYHEILQHYHRIVVD